MDTWTHSLSKTTKYRLIPGAIAPHPPPKIHMQLHGPKNTYSTIPEHTTHTHMTYKFSWFPNTQSELSYPQQYTHLKFQEFKNIHSHKQPTLIKYM